MPTLTPKTLTDLPDEVLSRIFVRAITESADSNATLRNLHLVSRRVHGVVSSDAFLAALGHAVWCAPNLTCPFAPSDDNLKIRTKSWLEEHERRLGVVFPPHIAAIVRAMPTPTPVPAIDVDDRTGREYVRMDCTAHHSLLPLEAWDLKPVGKDEGMRIMLSISPCCPTPSKGCRDTVLALNPRTWLLTNVSMARGEESIGTLLSFLRGGVCDCARIQQALTREGDYTVAVSRLQVWVRKFKWVLGFHPKSKVVSAAWKSCAERYTEFALSSYVTKQNVLDSCPEVNIEWLAAPGFSLES